MLGRIGRCGIGVALLAVASAGNAAVVISQVYGGAGCGTAGCSTYKNDYVEIFNNSAGAVNVNGWSVQYASATGTTTWQVTSLPNVSIPAGGYLLVGENGNANGNNDLPTPDVSGTLNMSATAGKVALVNSTTALNGACPIDGTVQDEVGYGATANCSETSPAPTFGDNTKAIFRAGSGCTDTGNNSTDFSPGSATPRNSASPVHLCGTVVTVDDVSHDEGNSSTTDFTFTVSLSAAAPAGGVTFDIATHDGTATVADGDYVENSATGVTIAEGETQAMFTVQVNGDTTAEADETFTVDVSNIAGTGVASTSAQGTGTIVNDDAVPATLSIDDVTHAEGDGGTTDFTFTVSLSAPAPVGGVTFDIATSDGTALVADLDYDMKALTSQSIAEGLTDYSFTVTVNGDTKYEADETFKVDVTNIVGSNVVTTAQHGTGTIVNDDPIRIGEIQGNGLASPYVGQTLTTAGNIVTAVGPKGFAMQDPVGDGDPDTSDGIYVFTNSAPTVSIGDVVTVTAQVQEFNNTTELGASPIVMVTGVGAPIGPIVLDTSLPSPNPDLHLCTGTLPATNASAGNWECIENMLVQIDGVVTGATNGGFAADGAHPGTPGFFFATVGDAPKPFREPGLIYPGAGGSIPVWDGNPEVIEFYPPGALGGPSAIVANAGQHFTSTSIVGDFKGTYELYPVTFSTTGAPPQTVVAVPAPVPGTLTIASQNMLRFFNDVKDSGSIDNCTGTSDTCPSSADFALRLKKLSLQVRNVLGAPAVVGVQEVENLATLGSLAGQIHADDASLSYGTHLFEGNDVGGIDVGFLVRSDVTVNNVTQLGKDTLASGAACTSMPCPLLNDRPPLLLDASYEGYHFAVLVVHDRSLGSVDDPTDGPRVRAKRLQQAQYVGEIVQAWQTGSATPLSDGDVVPDPDPTAPIIVIGDYNAYEFTDGYVDVTGQIKGTAVEAENLVWAAPVVTPTLCDAGLRSDPAQRYSFQFDGSVQELDHSLLSRIGWKDFVRLDNAHGNADTAEAGPEVVDDTTPARSADHDGQVLTLAVDRVFADDNEGDTCH